ncbi:SAM-dependent methyltransferase [Xanthobacter sp. KR7-225]|uniref:SAM-dependent methyltransferase n=1 Tax=Xanthobacter sp. KR7-225 TaxID=3156613 RepID=UPI0032B47707
MSGFSPDWLALREDADRRARSAAIDAAVAAALAAFPEPRICDLGAGTGASLRALAPLLGPRQHWVLVDHDPALAAAARRVLAAQADAARPDGADLVLDWGGRELRVSFAAADLAADPAAPLAFAPHLVTASAFFDLASARWCRAFAGAMAGASVMVHAALTCDGCDAWSPPHPADAAVHGAFRAHQARDKGFGPAAGPAAATILAEALTAAGHAVMIDESPWRLDAGDRALIAALAEGTANAAREHGGVPPDDLASWEAARRQAASCRIGHVDLFARPGR